MFIPSLSKHSRRYFRIKRFSVPIWAVFVFLSLLLLFLKNLTFNIRTWWVWERHLYISGINKTNYVDAWIGREQHMAIMNGSGVNLVVDSWVCYHDEWNLNRSDWVLSGNAGIRLMKVISNATLPDGHSLRLLMVELIAQTIIFIYVFSCNMTDYWYTSLANRQKPKAKHSFES